MWATSREEPRRHLQHVSLGVRQDVDPQERIQVRPNAYIHACPNDLNSLALQMIQEFHGSDARGDANIEQADSFLVCQQISRYLIYVCQSVRSGSLVSTVRQG